MDNLLAMQHLVLAHGHHRKMCDALACADVRLPTEHPMSMVISNVFRTLTEGGQFPAEALNESGTVELLRLAALVIEHDKTATIADLRKALESIAWMDEPSAARDMAWWKEAYADCRRIAIKAITRG